MCRYTWESEYSSDADEAAAADGKSKRSFSLVLHPSNRFRQAWDMMQVVILAYLAFTVPYRGGFKVGLYKLNALDPPLEHAWFQPSSL